MVRRVLLIPSANTLNNLFFATGWIIFGMATAALILVHILGYHAQDANNINHRLFQAEPHRSRENVKKSYRAIFSKSPLSSFKFNSNTTNINSTANLVDQLMMQSAKTRGANIATVLSKSVRVLCLILTTARYHSTRAIHVKETWAHRCTKWVFISDERNDTLQAVVASNQTEWSHVWSKTRAGFRWAYDNHINDFDWFMKADDDTFVILENLRALLLDYNPNLPYYFGYHFERDDWENPHAYTSGGAGYVLSRNAVKKLVEDSFSMPKYCSRGNKDVSEDVEIGRCLEHVGVAPSESRDSVGRHRFFPFPPSNHLTPGSSPPDMWIWTYSKYPYKEGDECCSNLAISFHYISPEEMKTMEYLVYRLQLFGTQMFSMPDEFVGIVRNRLSANKYEAPSLINKKNQ